LYKKKIINNEIMSEALRSGPISKEFHSSKVILEIIGSLSLVTEAQRKKDSDNTCVVLICGNAATGKSTAAMVTSELLSLPLLDEMPKVKIHVPKSPMQSGLLHLSAIDTDFFFHPRNSEVRKTKPFPEWLRRHDLDDAMSQLSEAIKNGDPEVKLKKLYDRQSGYILYNQEPYNLRIGPYVIITGMYSFDTASFFEKQNIPIMRIVVQAEREHAIHRMLDRNKTVIPSEEKVLKHIELDIDPLWKKISEQTGNQYDLAWASNYGAIVISKNQTQDDKNIHNA
jgi:pantothenate kinase